MLKRSFFAVAVLAAVFVIFGSEANAQGGVFLGNRTVPDRSDKDTLVVGARYGKFRRLQFRVKVRGIDFHKVKVHYANGGDEEISMRDRVPTGGQTRWIDLKGGRRTIEKIEFWYDAVSSPGQRAQVNIWGAR
jgi:hypothetical protein